MKKILAFIFSLFIFCIFESRVFAADACPPNFTCNGGCTAVGQCVNNRKCVSVRGVIYRGNEQCGAAQLGSVTPPSSVRGLNWQTGNVNGNGLILFLSKLINVFIIVCGVWTMFNFVMAGFSMIIAQNDTKVQTEVKDKFTMTVVGLSIIAGAYILAGLIGLVFFGDAGYILNPQLTSALSGDS